MKKYANFLASLLVSGLIGFQAHALSIDWSGGYRFEFTEVERTSLGDPKLRKSYILNHLHLSPKIIAADGVNIVARFDVLPNQEYPDSHLGQRFGRGPSTGVDADSNVGTDHQGATNLQVSQLYLNVNQEYGALLVGRAPKQFGLGMTHNAGLGEFDHWYDTHDMVGYKFVIGNLSLMPTLARVYDADAAAGQQVDDVIWDVQYNNPETESEFGLYHQTRTAGIGSNDLDGVYAGTKTGGAKLQTVNVLFGRGFEAFKMKFEAGFASGKTGITDGTGNEIKVNGYGIATEMKFGRPENKAQWSLRAGIASGDDPGTTDYEGFHFNRNYDVAFLMFNHPVGRYDLFRTAEQRTPKNCTTPPCVPGTAAATDLAMDDEAISNVVYVSPKLSYSFSDKWVWNNSITFAQLQAQPLANIEVDKNVGFEWDTGLVYQPSERVKWVNEFGFLFPGAAFEGGTNAFDKKFTYGFSSKAAISF